jgi:hypothetical protein
VNPSPSPIIVFPGPIARYAFWDRPQSSARQWTEVTPALLYRPTTYWFSEVASAPPHPIFNKYVRSKVLTVEVLKSSIFWFTISCSPLIVNQRFGGTLQYHLQGQRISKAGYPQYGVTWSSETSFDLQWTTMHHNSTRQNSSFSNLMVFLKREKYF